ACCLSSSPHTCCLKSTRTTEQGPAAPKAAGSRCLQIACSDTVPVPRESPARAARQGAATARESPWSVRLSARPESSDTLPFDRWDHWSEPFDTAGWHPDTVRSACTVLQARRVQQLAWAVGQPLFSPIA